MLSLWEKRKFQSFPHALLGARQDLFNELDFCFSLGNYGVQYDSSMYCDTAEIVITNLIGFAIFTKHDRMLRQFLIH